MGEEPVGVGYCVWTPYHRSFVPLPRDNAQGVVWNRMRSTKLRGR